MLRIVCNETRGKSGEVEGRKAGGGGSRDAANSRRERGTSPTHTPTPHLQPSPPPEDGDATPSSPPPPSTTARVILKLLVSNAAAGAVIGRGGGAIGAVQAATGARVQLARAGDTYPGTPDRVLLVAGPLAAVLTALHLILETLAADPAATTPPLPGAPPLALRLLVPPALCGAIIGRGGATIRSFADDARASISVAPPDAAGPDRVVRVAGSQASCVRAVALLLAKLAGSPHYARFTNASVSYTPAAGGGRVGGGGLAPSPLQRGRLRGGGSGNPVPLTLAPQPGVVPLMASGVPMVAPGLVVAAAAPPPPPPPPRAAPPTVARAAAARAAAEAAAATLSARRSSETEDGGEGESVAGAAPAAAAAAPPPTTPAAPKPPASDTGSPLAATAGPPAATVAGGASSRPTPAPKTPAQEGE